MSRNELERLQDLLDDEGIQWSEGDASYSIEWDNSNGQRCSVMYWKPSLTFLVSGCTSEQVMRIVHELNSN